MAGSKTNWMEQKTLEHNLGIASAAFPTSLKLHLYTTDPTDTGAAGTEVSGGGYVPQTIVLAAVTGTEPTTTSNNALISFPKATALQGNITHWTIKDQLSNVRYHGDFTTAKLIDVNDTFEIDPNELDIEEG